MAQTRPPRTAAFCQPKFHRHLTPAAASCTSKKFPRTPAGLDASTPARSGFQKFRFSDFRLPCPLDRPKNLHRPKTLPEAATAACRMGAVIPPCNRCRLGRFLGQPGATCLRIPSKRSPLIQPDRRRGVGCDEFLGNFITSDQFTQQTHSERSRATDRINSDKATNIIHHFINSTAFALGPLSF